jgi:hypothetical protein
VHLKDKLIISPREGRKPKKKLKKLKSSSIIAS